MLNHLKLTNFKKHEDKVFNFDKGLVVLKGANENGKSSMLAAILYLWLGARVLGEPLEDVVTYGKDVKTLRVEGSFTVDGVDYAGYRSASGAELTYGNQRVTGQTGVTQFMERLLGAKSDVIRKLMIAEQNSVRGILESDTNAGALIETLADLGVIDTLIDKVKHQRPCGPTVAAESAIAVLQSAIGEVPVEPSDTNVKTAKQAVQLASVHLEAARQEDEHYQLEKSGALSLLEQSRAAQAAYSAVSARQETLRALVAPAPCAYSQEDIATAERYENDNAQMEKARKAFMLKPGTCAPSWNGSAEDLTVHIRCLENTLVSVTEKSNNLKLKRNAKLSLKINEDVCSFCKKDISELPEVAQINSKADLEVKAIDEDLASVQSVYASAKSDLDAAKEVASVHNSNLLKMDRQFWEPLGGPLPVKFKWVGPVISDSVSLSVTSSAMKKLQREYETAVARYDAAQQELLTLTFPELVPEAHCVIARQSIDAASQSAARLKVAQTELQLATSKLSNAETVYTMELREYNAALARREKAQEEVGKAEQVLTDTVFYNQLIKDLQSARAEIRRRLWDSVTSAISVYFSRIRQVETRITQSEDGFLQNGKPVKGLSGSAKDSLGLAVRAALLKTFIPGAPILVVDEPFAACDENREIAALGVLQSLGFPQTILVTHSDLADSMANQLIEL